VLSQLRWGERAVAHLLDQLLWTTPKKKSGVRERVHYGPLDVEDLGRVYEALLELEPGLANEPMCRLRRQKLEVVVPLAQGEKYRPPRPLGEGPGVRAVRDFVRGSSLLHFRRTLPVKELILTAPPALGDAAFFAQEAPHREGKGWPSVNGRASVRNPGTRPNAALLGTTSDSGSGSETCDAGRPRRPSSRSPVR
jgi:hypothetical protein